MGDWWQAVSEVGPERPKIENQSKQHKNGLENEEKRVNVKYLHVVSVFSLSLADMEVFF